MIWFKKNHLLCHKFYLQFLLFFCFFLTLGRLSTPKKKHVFRPIEIVTCEFGFTEQIVNLIRVITGLTVLSASSLNWEFDDFSVFLRAGRLYTKNPA